MANNNDIQKLTSFLNKLDQIQAESSTIDEPSNDTEESCHIPIPVDSSKREGKFHYLQKCLKENEDCHTLLKLLESSISVLLEKCIEEQQIVNANLEICLREEDNSPKTRKDALTKILCAPYFKDESGFSPPYNRDVSNRSVQGFCNPYKVIMRPWHAHQKKILVQFIRSVEEEKWRETLKSCGMLHMANIEQMTLKELIESRYDEYDWLKISASYLNNVHSAEECKLLWYLCLHPEINRGVWSKKESEKLKSLVLHHASQDWEAIAQELGTKRSAFLTFVHFQQDLVENRVRQWREKEIDALKHYVKLFTCKGYIQWHKLRRFIDGRNLEEMYTVLHNINFGDKPWTFSFEEDIVLVAGLRIFGRDITRIKEYLPDRTLSQIWKRVEILKYRQFPKQPWSNEEDVLLKKLVNKYGYGSWKRISMHYVNRNSQAIRSRFRALQSKDDQSSAPTRSITQMRKYDNVNITLLWESVVKICHENNISMDNLDNFSMNIVHELSKILKPQMRSSKIIADSKLKPFSDNMYNRFLVGAYRLNESKPKSTKNMGKIVRAFVHDVVTVLKLLEAKINLPVSKEIKKDPAISCQDKLIIKYLIKEIESRNSVCSDIFLPFNSKKQNMAVHKNAGIIPDNSHYLLPPNISTLLAMRSLHLNHKNLEEQKEGLTMQLDNIEFKHFNELCVPRINYGNNYMTASKIWEKRMDLLLSGVAIMLKEEGKTSTDPF